jgi:hypothetical protein
VPAVPAPLLLIGQVVGAALLGAALAALGTVAHLYVTGSGRWPVGLVLALALTVSGGLLLRALGPPLVGVVAALLGWLVMVLPAISRRREGDLLIGSGGRGLAFLGLGFLVLALVLVVPAGGRRRPEVRVGS